MKFIHWFYSDVYFYINKKISKHNMSCNDLVITLIQNNIIFFFFFFLLKYFIYLKKKIKKDYDECINNSIIILYIKNYYINILF